MSLIEARGLGVARGGTRVLHDVDLSVDEGEIVTVVGPNGSGKSTLMRAMIGAVPISAGTIRRAPGLRVGYVPQTLSIDRTLPLTTARFLSLPGPVARAEVARALDLAGVPETAERPLSGLSGGQLQRILLARAILGAPQLLILDEATRGLDQPSTAAFYRRIEALRAETGAAILMVSHELHVVMAASDRVICLNGHVCCAGHPEQVASAPEYRALFGTGTGGALALYRHEHTHRHDASCDHSTVQEDAA